MINQVRYYLAMYNGIGTEHPGDRMWTSVRNSLKVTLNGKQQLRLENTKPKQFLIATTKF